jgi:hypothetical protein
MWLCMEFPSDRTLCEALRSLTAMWSAALPRERQGSEPGERPVSAASSGARNHCDAILARRTGVRHRRGKTPEPRPGRRDQTGTGSASQRARWRIVPYLDQGGACGWAGPASLPRSALAGRAAHAGPRLQDPGSSRLIRTKRLAW